jgi:hypothetical protein
MSPKAAATFRLYVMIAVGALPGLAAVWAGAGYTRIGAALSLAALSLAVVWHAYQTNISELSTNTTPPAAGSGTADTTVKMQSPPASPFRSMPGMPGMLGLGALTVVWTVTFAYAGCTPSQQTTAVATIPSAVAFTVCVISTYAADTAAKYTATQIAADELQKCGGDAVSIAQILDAHSAALVIEGHPAGGASAVAVALRASGDAGTGG